MFVCFVDFKKAFDSICRGSWVKMQHLGFEGKLLNTIQSMYTTVQYSIKINDLITDFFSRVSNKGVPYHQHCLTYSIMT